MIFTQQKCIYIYSWSRRTRTFDIRAKIGRLTTWLYPISFKLNLIEEPSIFFLATLVINKFRVTAFSTKNQLLIVKLGH